MEGHGRLSGIWSQAIYGKSSQSGFQAFIHGAKSVLPVMILIYSDFYLLNASLINAIGIAIEKQQQKPYRPKFLQKKIKGLTIALLAYPKQKDK